MSQQNSDQYSSDFPLWIWRFVWVVLLGVVGVGITLLIALAAGAADPPHRGGLVRQSGPLPEVTALSGEPAVTVAAFDLVPFPYTLKITGRLMLDNPRQDLFPTWDIVFEGSSFSIRLYRERYFAVLPSLPDTTAFIHIRPAGESNKIYLDVDGRGQGTLRINDEIAWQGTVPAAKKIMISLDGGKTGGTLSIQQIALYGPTA